MYAATSSTPAVSVEGAAAHPGERGPAEGGAAEGVPPVGDVMLKWLLLLGTGIGLGAEGPATAAAGPAAEGDAEGAVPAVPSGDFSSVESRREAMGCDFAVLAILGLGGAGRRGPWVGGGSGGHPAVGGTMGWREETCAAVALAERERARRGHDEASATLR